MMPEQLSKIFETAEENSFEWAVVCYTVDSEIENSIMVNHVALYKHIPLFFELVELFASFANDMEKFNLTDEKLATMFIRLDTIESLRSLVKNAEVTGEIRQIHLTDKGEFDEDGWEHGVKGNA